MKAADMVTRPQGIPDDVALGLPNCGVLSVTMLSGLPYESVWDLLKAQQRGNGRGWKGRTYDRDRKAVMKAIGLDYEVIMPEAATLRQWLMSDQYQRSGTYEVCVTGHAMVLHRHRLFDQNAGRKGCLAHESPYLRRKMQSVVQVHNGPLRSLPLNTNTA